MTDRELTALQMGDTVAFQTRPLSELIEGARTLGIDPRDLLVTGKVIPTDKPTDQHKGDARE